MRLSRVIPFRELVTAMLIASLSICCCQAGFVLDDLSVAGTAGSCVVAVDGPPSCCCKPATSDAPLDQPDEPGTPLQSCKSCCIKGSGLEDPGGLPAAPTAVAMVIPAALISPSHRPEPRVVSTLHARRDVEPSTLVRLHCALIVERATLINVVRRVIASGASRRRSRLICAITPSATLDRSAARERASARETPVRPSEQNVRALRPPRPRAWPIGAALLLAGCASLDPAEDIDRAAALVSARAGVEPAWSAPWDEPSAAWDGRSDLSSDAAARAALQNNRVVRGQVETIVATRADLVQAHLLPNPIINVALGFPTDGMGGDPLVVALMQELTCLWRRPAAIDAAEADLRRRVLAVSDAALRTVADARRAHARVVFAERAAALQRENIDLIEHTLALLDDRFSVGEASRLDVNRFELDLHQATVELVDREAALDAAKRRLLELLGRADAGVAWRTDDDVPVAARAAHLDEPAVIALASTQRLDVTAAGADVEGRAARLDFAERGRLPDLEAGVGYQQNFSNRRGVFPAISVRPKLFDDNGARVARAASELRQAAIEADRVRQTAIAEARQAWVALRAQENVVRSYEQEIVALAAQNLDLARQAYDAGEADLTVLLEAQRARNDAAIALTDRQHAAVDRMIELERAAGGSLQVQPPLDDAFATSAASAGEPTPHDVGREVAP